VEKSNGWTFPLRLKIPATAAGILTFTTAPTTTGLAISSQKKEKRIAELQQLT
jgi:hypothetical protein